jgi:hypothetical protein
MTTYRKLDPQQRQGVKQGEAELRALAKQVREIYIVERRIHDERANPDQPSTYMPGPWWDGGRTHQGAHRKSIWPKIAEMLLAEGWDAGDYIRSTFAAHASCRAPAQSTAQREAEGSIPSERIEQAAEDQGGAGPSGADSGAAESRRPHPEDCQWTAKQVVFGGCQASLRLGKSRLPKGRARVD